MVLRMIWLFALVFECYPTVVLLPCLVKPHAAQLANQNSASVRP